MKLEKCPDKHAKVYLKFTFFLLQEIDIEGLSKMSGKTLNDSFEEDDQPTTTDMSKSKSDSKLTEKKEISKEITNDIGDQKSQRIKDLEA